MAWIRTDTTPEPGSELAQLIDLARDPRSGELDHIMAIHSLHPAGLAAHLALYQAVMRGSRSLPAVDRELIALAVSKANDCHY